MTAGDGGAEIEVVAPGEAHRHLKEDPDTALVDVRTAAEWAFVGIPDLSEIGRRLVTVEWIDFPGMQPNRDFVAELESAFGGQVPGRLFFICRSGARSLAAARLVAQATAAAGRPVRCANVAEGFEGDLDAAGHRGKTNGWKVAGLPWRQN